MSNRLLAETLPRRPFDRPGSTKRIAPFALVASLAVASLSFSPATATEPIFAALVLTVVGVLFCALAPWTILPARLQAVPPFGYYLIVALVGHAGGSATSGFAPLAALPVFWLALYGTRRQLLAAVVTCGVVFSAPIVLIGAPEYPLSDLRRAFVWICVTGLIGPAVQRLVRRGEQKALDLRLVATLAQSGSVEEMRASACAVASGISDASFVALFEPDRSGALVCTAALGAELLGASVRADNEPSATWIAYRSRRRYLVTDATSDTTVSPRFTVMTGAVSAIFEPLPAEDGCVGVLVLGFSEPLESVDADLTYNLELIARETSWVLQRSLYVERIDTLAESVSDVIVVQGPSGEALFVSGSVKNVLGYEPDEYLHLFAHNMSSLIHPEDLPIIARLGEVAPSSTPHVFTFRCLHKEGHWIWMESYIKILGDEDGNITQIRSSSRDVSDRKAADDIVRLTRDRLQSVLDAATEYSIIGTDIDGTINVFNVGAEKMLGYRAEEVIGLQTPEVIHDADEVRKVANEMGIEPSFDVFVSKARQNQTETRNWTYITRDENKVPVTLSVSPSHGLDGSVDGFIGIASDVSAREAALSELTFAFAREKDLVEELRELDRTKQSFVASVTHDLKTPLASIKGYAEMMLDVDVERLSDSHKRMIDVIDRNSSRLLTMIDDLLEIARMDSAAVPKSRATIDLVKLVQGVEESLRPVAMRKRVSLSCEFEGQDLSIVGDPDQLDRALGNIVSNAVKFTSEAGSVGVQARADIDKAVVIVRDTGVGVPAEDKPTIFERFTRASNAREQQIPGTGLGLGIAKQIIEQHGGALSLESEVGVGTTVTVELPLRRVDR